MSKEMYLKLTLPLPISVNNLYKNKGVYNKKLKAFIPTGQRIMSPEGEKLKKQIQEAAREQMKDQNWNYEWTKKNFIYLDTYLFFNRAGRDADNTYKLLQDSLAKIVFDNDSRVLVRTQRILFDNQNPRVIIEAFPVPHKGIFNNQEQLDEFESKCKTCKRYKRNCSILNKAKEGRIQKEIDSELNCSKFKEVKNEKTKIKHKNNN